MLGNVDHTCQVCGKRLQAYLCLACGGKSQVRELLFTKRACEACGGAGKVYRCPDSFKHATGNLGKFTYKPGSGRIAEPKKQQCPLCHGARGVPDPRTRRPVPCPKCRGKGWI
jgi:DnaJ-class molecular chaperone